MASRTANYRLSSPPQWREESLTLPQKSGSVSEISVLQTLSSRREIGKNQMGNRILNIFPMDNHSLLLQVVFICQSLCEDFGVHRLYPSLCSQVGDD